MRFKVEKYVGKKTLTDLLTTKEVNFIKDIPTSENKHFKYFENYFNDKKVKTIVFEFNYIDKDYLEDYSNYYSRCFKDYTTKCIRLHAFSIPFDDSKFEKLLLNRSTNFSRKKLNDNYVGFIVLRPIPLTLIGRTCLSVYPGIPDKSKTSTRFYPIVRNYNVNLFGIELTLQSIAYQEQDKAVSACATSALWTAFQGTGSLFHHHYPSPYQITLSATKIITYADRGFPSKGLVLQQMAHAIIDVGLSPIIISSLNSSYFKAILNAFLKGGIPVIIGFRLTNKNEVNNDPIGLHAVTATGFCIDTTFNEEFVLEKSLDANQKCKFLMKSSLISKIYVHDDQLGPFARMEFSRDSNNLSLSTTWGDIAPEQYQNVEATPNGILIPAYAKIRIPYEKVREIIYDFNSQVLLSLGEEIVWDIYLSTVTNFKKNILIDSNIEEKQKLNLLTKDFPKYLWLAEAFVNNNNFFSLVFDATDIENGNLFLCGIHYEPFVSFEIKSIAQIEIVYKKQTYQVQHILDYYLNIN